MTETMTYLRLKTLLEKMHQENCATERGGENLDFTLYLCTNMISDGVRTKSLHKLLVKEYQNINSSMLLNFT